MAIPTLIKQMAHKIRTEIYGKDVRESIAKSMEVTGETAEEARKRSLEQLDRVDTLIGENPQPSEVVDARGGFSILRDRLNSVDSRIEATVYFIEPNMTQEEINQALQSYKHIRFLKGVYIVDPRDSILPQSNQIIEFEPGAEIKATGVSTNTYQILKIVNTENLTILGGLITGERDSHTGTGGEWGHGVHMENNKNLTIRKMTVRDCWGDGFYHLSGENTHLDNVEADNNRRNNISVISGNVVIMDSPKLTRANGAPPQAGIDLEPNLDGEVMKGIIINNPVFENNAQNDIGMLLDKLTSEDTIDIEINNPVSINKEVSQPAMIAISGIRANLKGKININGGFSENKRFLSYSNVSSNVIVNIKNPTIKDWANNNLGGITIRNSFEEVDLILGNITIDNPKFIIDKYSGASTGIEIIDDRNIEVQTDPIYVNNPEVIGRYKDNIQPVYSSYGLNNKFGNVHVSDGSQSRDFIDYSFVQEYTLGPGNQILLKKPQDIDMSRSFDMLVEAIVVNTGGLSGEIALFKYDGNTSSWEMKEVLPYSRMGGGATPRLLLDGNNKPALRNTHSSTQYNFLVKTTISGVYSIGKSKSYYNLRSRLMTYKAKSLANAWNGPTGVRPTNPEVGQSFFDTVLNKTVSWSGEKWVEPAMYIHYTSNPEGTISASAGTFCYDYINNVLYIKRDNAGNTGWRALAWQF